MAATKAARLQQFINLVVNAGCQDELDDESICRLALDLDPLAIFVFTSGMFEIVFTDNSHAAFDQVPQCL